MAKGVLANVCDVRPMPEDRHFVLRVAVLLCRNGEEGNPGASHPKLYGLDKQVMTD